MPNPTTYRILGANVRRPAKAGENYTRTPADVDKMLRGLIAAHGYDALILLEASQYHAALTDLGKALGYDVLFWADKGRGDNVLLVRNTIPHDAGAVIEHGPDAWWIASGGGKSWGRGHVTVKLPGLRLVGVHTPPSVNWVKGVEVGPANRIRTFVAMMTSLRTAIAGWTKSEPNDGLLIYGDWNEPPTSTGADSPNDVAADNGLTVFPGVSIDWSMGRNVQVKTRAIKVGAEGNTSDHPLLDMTVTIPAHVDPAPMPAPVPAPTPAPEAPVTTAARLIQIAKNEIGYHEGRNSAGWNNIQKFSPAVPSLEWSQGQAWCATFVSWVAMKAGVAELFPRTASTDTAAAWFKKAGRWSEYPAVGAWGFLGTGNDMHHVFLVTGFDADFVYTVEGNTNNNGSAQGDGVYALKRRRRGAGSPVGYGYPKYPEGIVSADPAWAKPAPAAPGRVTPAAPPVAAGEQAARNIEAGVPISAVKRPKVRDLMKKAAAALRGTK